MSGELISKNSDFFSDTNISTIMRIDRLFL